MNIWLRMGNDLIMKDLNILNNARNYKKEISIYGCNGDSGNGLFEILCPPTNRLLNVIASNGEGWEHVSVSTTKRCPNWTEMEFIKRIFFEADETVMQLHVPAEDHINLHPNCLHLWRPIGVEIPRPPAKMVAV